MVMVMVMVTVTVMVTVSVVRMVTRVSEGNMQVLGRHPPPLHPQQEHHHHLGAHLPSVGGLHRYPHALIIPGHRNLCYAALLVRLHANVQFSVDLTQREANSLAFSLLTK